MLNVGWLAIKHSQGPIHLDILYERSMSHPIKRIFLWKIHTKTCFSGDLRTKQVSLLQGIEISSEK